MKKTTILCLTAALASGVVSAQVTLKDQPGIKGSDHCLFLSNPYLTVRINISKNGAVDQFIPANTNHDEVFSNQKVRYSFGYMRPSEMTYGEQHAMHKTPANYKIVKNTPDEVTIRCSYRVPTGRCAGLEYQMEHTMLADSAALYTNVKIINHAKETRTLVPWLRNIVSGYRPPQIQFDQAGLDTESSLILKEGTFRKPATETDCFVEPARNWFARVPKAPSKEKNILYCIFDYSEVFQFYTVHFKYLHTMEMIFRMLELKPGKTWETKYMTASGGTMADVRFASPDIAANLERKNGKLELQITSPRNLKNAAVELLNDKGKLIGKQNIDITACRTSTLLYPDAKGEIFELKVRHHGKDLMLDKRYTPSNSKMTATLHWLTALRQPENLPEKLKPWKKTNAFPTIPARKCNVPLLKTNSSVLQVWPELSINRIFEQDQPVAKETGKPVEFEISAAKGEREHFQLAIRNNGKSLQKDFSVTFTVDTLPAENLSWNVLDYITTKQPSMGEKLIGRWPDIMDPARSFAVKPGQTRAVWLGIKIPRTQKAGIYTGKVRLLRQQKTIAELPLKIRVFDFALPQRPHFRTDAGMFFGNALAMAKRYGFKGKKSDLNIQLAETLLEHRMSPRGLPVSAAGSLKEYEKWLKRYIEAGANVFFFPKPQYVGKKRVETLEKLHEKYGVLKQSYVYGFDEIHADQIPKVKAWCDKWHKERKIPILVVYYGGPVEPLYGCIDIWCRAHWKEDQKLIAERTPQDQVWTTNTPYFAIEREPVLGRAKIWQAFAEGMTGCLLWSTACWTVSPYTQPYRSGTNLTGLLFYPSPEGIRPGARFKMMADAVEDYEYLYILRDEMQKAKKAKRNAALVKQAEALLADPFYGGKDLTGEKYQQKRTLAGDLIEKLRKVK